MNKEVIISIRELCKKFGSFTAVKDVSFDINKGEIFGLLGPNGAGKTTTIRMICGLLTPTSGEIFINGYKRGSKNNHAYNMGICPQENIHWEKLTCREQLIFMGSMYNLKAGVLKRKSGELLEMLGLTEKAGILAAKLSGGMKRRLNIALALIHDPEILIMDEPEAGLDPQSRVLVRDFIKSLSKDKTIILTTHNMDEADRLAQRIGIIDHGKLLLIDTPEQLKQTIGQGDILEIEIADTAAENLKSLEKSLATCCNEMKRANLKFQIRASGLIQKIPLIAGKFIENKTEITKMTVRENTLEDVFIHLTGRNLRE